MMKRIPAVLLAAAALLAAHPRATLAADMPSAKNTPPVADMPSAKSTPPAANVRPADNAPPAADAAAAKSTLPTNLAMAKLAASAESAELVAFRKAIRAKYALKEKAFAAHDAETIVTRFYSPDVISVGEGEGIFIGRDQIRPLYQEVVKDNQVKIDSVHTFVSGDAGWDWADFHVTPTAGQGAAREAGQEGGQGTAEGKDKREPFTFAILFLWAKVDGQWLCKGDFFMNGSFRTGKLAPPAAAGSK